MSEGEVSSKLYLTLVCFCKQITSCLKPHISDKLMPVIVIPAYQSCMCSRLANERQAEDHLFGDKDRFVTSAYKRKLEEDKKWLAEEKLREELEAREDVVKKGHMGDFYRYSLLPTFMKIALLLPSMMQLKTWTWSCCFTASSVLS